MNPGPKPDPGPEGAPRAPVAAAGDSAGRRSGRLCSGVDLDVDLYLLDSRGGGASSDRAAYLLFAHLKAETVDGGEARLRALADGLPGEVVVIGRAHKTPERSTPLPPLWLGARATGPLYACEAGCRYGLEVEDVLNPGLFLDQARNRARLGELIAAALPGGPGAAGEDDGLLNLFSYTGSFSIAARAAGLPHTTSVDVSARYLAWERRNAEANFGDAVAPRLIRDDARDFVRRAARRGARYRFIVVDPPTFSRGQGKAFRVRTELLPLVEAAVACFPADGPAACLASTNDAGFPEGEFAAELERLARRLGLRYERGAVPDEFRDTHAKSGWLLRGL